MRRAQAAALALVLMSAASCGDSTAPGNPCVGTFNGSVSGSGTVPNATFSGCSYYTAGGFVTLSLGQGGHTIGLSISGPRPATGDHTIGEFGTTDPIKGTFTFTGNTVRTLFSVSGTLTVTESSAGKLKGTITMNVREGGFGAPVVATVTATFDAPCSLQPADC